MFAGLFKKPGTEVHDLYASVVEKARDPAFYAVLGVPDTVDGRFDMIVLHAMLVLRRLRGQGEAAERRGQELFDLMFKDMDQSLRELGVGDMSVGKHIKRMAQAFYGRAERYEAGLDAKLADPADTALAQALTENIFRKGAPEARLLDVMQDYLIRADRHIAAQDAANLVAGRLDTKVSVT
jgi:cytochrome b pre-mRNA-processing protein 3